MPVMLFWLSVAVLIAVALIFLLPPLLGRGRSTRGPASADVNAAVYRARIEELEREVADGTLDPEDFEPARTELQREILDSADGETPGESGARPSTAAALCVAALLPVTALGIYLALGSPDAVGWKQSGARDGAAGASAGQPDRDALERMAASFADRLAQNPEEGDGWLVLGRAYVMLDQYDRAVDAFARAHALLGDTPDLLVDYAEAEAMVNQNRFPPEARMRIERALEIAPRHEKGLWLGAFAAAQQGDIDTAVGNWRKLLEDEDDSDRRRLIEGLIARVQGAPLPKAPSIDASAGVTVQVTLDPRLGAQLSGSETVFVFARAESGEGPPLAVHRTAVEALPATIVLDDSMSMVPGLKISEKDRVVVTARVSLSGDARPGSGDLQGQSGPVEVGNASPAEVLIDEKLP